MKTFFKLNCWLYDRVLSLHDDNLRFRHGDEMRFLFRKQLSHAIKQGSTAVAAVWKEIAHDTLTLVGPLYLGRLRLLSISFVAASLLVAGFLLAFCSFGKILVVHGCDAEPITIAAPAHTQTEQLVPIADGHKMFLECGGDPHRSPTVVLATGAGLGSYQAWSAVQSQVEPFARVCSFDPLGAGKSDHVPGAHTIASVVDTMHQIFHAAPIPAPYLLVGASAGGVLIRRYQQRYPNEVAGFVFVDSAHEEQEWRDAAISKSFDPDWNNPSTLEANGMLPRNSRSPGTTTSPSSSSSGPTCRSAAPSPPSPIPNATSSIKHGMASRSTSPAAPSTASSAYGQLRRVANSGHAMHQQQPQAIQDVLSQLPPSA